LLPITIYRALEISPPPQVIDDNSFPPFLHIQCSWNVMTLAIIFPLFLILHVEGKVCREMLYSRFCKSPMLLIITYTTLMNYLSFYTLCAFTWVYAQWSEIFLLLYFHVLHFRYDISNQYILCSWNFLV